MLPGESLPEWRARRSVVWRQRRAGARRVRWWLCAVGAPLALFSGLAWGRAQDLAVGVVFAAIVWFDRGSVRRQKP